MCLFCCSCYQFVLFACNVFSCFVHVYQFVPFVFLFLFDLFVPFSLSLFTFFFIYLLIYVFCFSFTFHNHLFDVYSSSLALVSLCFFLSSAVHTCGLKQPLLFLFSKPKFPPFSFFLFFPVLSFVLLLALAWKWVLPYAARRIRLAVSAENRSAFGVIWSCGRERLLNFLAFSGYTRVRVSD